MCLISEHVPENVMQLTTAAHSCGRPKTKTVYSTRNAIRMNLIINSRITNTASHQCLRIRMVNIKRNMEWSFSIHATIEKCVGKHSSRVQIFGSCTMGENISM